jgi:hypothetical protein
MLTDYLLGLECLILAALLVVGARLREQKIWAVGLVGTGLAALAGGTVHGFGWMLPPILEALLWKITVYAIGVASVSFALATVLARVGPKGKRWLVGVLVGQFIVYAIWMVQHGDFKYVIGEYVPAMLLILFLEIHHAWIWDSPGSRSVVVGILLSFLAAGVQQSKWDPFPSFNHNDLYHCLQMIAMYYLYRGGLRMDKVEHESGRWKTPPSHP